MKNIGIYIESFLFAFKSLVVNRLRTMLSLLGISIGIFTIITVMTVIDALEGNIRTSIAALGDNMIYVQKWPWSFSSEYPWWKYMARPLPKLSEADQLRRRCDKAEACAFGVGTRRDVQYDDRTADNITIFASEHDYINIRSFEIGQGRYFSPFESSNGTSCAVLGAAVAENLFGKQNPVGKEIKIFGRKITVVGVYKREGDDMFGVSADNEVHLPINFIRNLVDIRQERLNPFIMVKARANVTADELIDELKVQMRAIRRLKPMEEDDFALNRSSLISKGFEGIFTAINGVGWIIGMFSVLVGGFGIANIMFVSVKEQTRIIGIQKALGAKKRFIMLQFLYEAVLLALAGGTVGLLVVFGLTGLIGSASGMDIGLSFGNIMIGTSISLIIGILAGIVPAYMAARLDPVVAISSL